MTDPRLAALAAALTEVQGGAYASWLGRVPAILAALPPDWCGHIGVEEAIAQGQRMLVASEQAADREITRLQAELRVAHLDDTRDAEIVSLRNSLTYHTEDPREAELARLRAIEEAARLAVREPFWCNWGAGQNAALDALRAALEAER
jgi:hypothetical protein